MHGTHATVGWTSLQCGSATPAACGEEAHPEPQRIAEPSLTPCLTFNAQCLRAIVPVPHLCHGPLAPTNRPNSDALHRTHHCCAPFTCSQQRRVAADATRRQKTSPPAWAWASSRSTPGPAAAARAAASRAAPLGTSHRRRARRRRVRGQAWVRLDRGRPSAAQPALPLTVASPGAGASVASRAARRRRAPRGCDARRRGRQRLLRLRPCRLPPGLASNGRWAASQPRARSWSASAGAGAVAAASTSRQAPRAAARLLPGTGRATGEPLQRAAPCLRPPQRCRRTSRPARPRARRRATPPRAPPPPGRSARALWQLMTAPPACCCCSRATLLTRPARSSRRTPTRQQQHPGPRLKRWTAAATRAARCSTGPPCWRCAHAAAAACKQSSPHPPPWSAARRGPRRPTAKAPAASPPRHRRVWPGARPAASRRPLLQVPGQEAPGRGAPRAAAAPTC